MVLGLTPKPPAEALIYTTGELAGKEAWKDLCRRRFAWNSRQMSATSWCKPWISCQRRMN